MILHVIIGQRKNNYPGEYAPEALSVICENGLNENPSFVDKEMKKYLDYKEFDSLSVIMLQVSNDIIHDHLYPKAQKIFEPKIIS